MNKTATTVEAKPVKPAEIISGLYPQLTAWPRDAGAGKAPAKHLILAAMALGCGKRGKKVLALASYMRPDSHKYPTGAVAVALQTVCGGDFNPLHNVANIEFCHRLKLGVVSKTKVDNGTAYTLHLNAKAKAKVTDYLATFGIAVNWAQAVTDGHFTIDGLRPDKPKPAHSEPAVATDNGQAAADAYISHDAETLPVTA